MIAVIIFAVIKAPDLCRTYIYPEKYSELVETYSQKYGVDKYLVYAVIKTESNFDPNACSEVGARGLMQIMEDAYDWVGYRMNEERELSYDCMYVPEYNIEYGTYLLKLLYEEFGNEEAAIAAYHTGRGNVNSWLKDPEYSSDGVTLDKMPSSATAHYVSKVMRAYANYRNLYENN
ncbi:MAG: lytic transglycosylase domain-containing protein [Huintestinicola sp.]